METIAVIRHWHCRVAFQHVVWLFCRDLCWQVNVGELLGHLRASATVVSGYEDADYYAPTPPAGGYLLYRTRSVE